MKIGALTLLLSLASTVFGSTTADAGIFGKRRCCQQTQTVCPTVQACPKSVTRVFHSRVIRCDSAISCMPREAPRISSQFEIIQLPVEVERTANGEVFKEIRMIEIVVPTGASPEVQEAFRRLQIAVNQNTGTNSVQDVRLDDLETP